MPLKNKFAISITFLILIFVLSSPNVIAKDKEYDAIVKHLTKNYQAKKVKVPFMWLARLAVRVVKPAGVRSFSFTMFEDLKFSSETLDEEMKSIVGNSLSPEWLPILRIRSRNGDQVYAYMREAGKNVRMMMVTMNKDQATVIKATFNPEKLAEFINNPKIFGISIGDDDRRAENKVISGDTSESK